MVDFVESPDSPYQSFFENAVVGMYLTTPDGQLHEANLACARIFGFETVAEFLDRHSDGLGELYVNRDDRDRVLEASRKSGSIVGFEFEAYKKDGRRIWVSSSARAVRDEAGNIRSYEGSILDITDRRQTEEILHEGIEALPVGFAVYDADSRLLVFNQNYRNTFSIYGHLLKPGMRFEDLMRPTAHLVGPQQGIEDPEEFLRQRILSAKQGGRRWLYQQTSGHWIETYDRPTSSGGFVSVRTDVTEDRHREDKFRQAQKMEALGHLTGGVAHDFNNLLAIIQGHAALLDRKLEADGKLRALTAPIIRAAKRGASLTSRLLAFSRQQPLDAKVINPGELIVDLEEMLRRSLGEDIAVTIETAENLWTCEIDAGQLEQAIINLANNARDAMPNGGRLTIRAENLPNVGGGDAPGGEHAHGDQVMISVTDTGDGIPADALRSVFDPFFTTKEVGKGTGLGLSMVYGFLEQSGGHVTVESEQGVGTTFQLHLPRHGGEGATANGPRHGCSASRGRGETVLIVEDDDDLRGMVRTLLVDLGYQVLDARAGPAALEVIRNVEEIDLLLTDYILPQGMFGKELAERATKEVPTIKVLYMSGYAPESTAHDCRIDPSVRLLSKPFEPDELAREIRAALDAKHVQ